MSDALKVLHAPVNIGNQPWALSRAERQLGARSDLAINYNTWINYPHDICLADEYGDKSEETMARRKAFVESAPRDYDVLHYYFGRTLACWDDYGPRDENWFSDLFAAKELGKKTFMTLQGCDARLAGQSDKRYDFTPCRQGACGAFENCVSTYDAERQYLIDTILPELDRFFYLNPELGHYAPGGAFLPYASVDWRDYQQLKPNLDGRIKIVHGPSDPATKGTHEILSALDELWDDYDLEIILVKGMTHAEAMQKYAEADIAIDQVLYGWYGGFAVELMAMGKPVLAYLREEDYEHVPQEMLDEMAVINIDTHNLARDIKAVLDARAEWHNWSDKARNFVKKWHDPQKLAAAMLECYRSPTSEFNLAAHLNDH